MAHFKNIQRFVALVEEENTRNDNDRALPMVSLADLNYRIDQAMKKDNALNAFAKDYNVKNKKAVEIFDQAKELKFIRFLTSERESPDYHQRVAGEIILVEFKGKELIRKPRVLHRFLAWLDYRNKVVVLLLAFLGAAILGNLPEIIRWIARVT